MRQRELSLSEIKAGLKIVHNLSVCMFMELEY
jgi:hypothetical protein